MFSDPSKHLYWQFHIWFRKVKMTRTVQILILFLVIFAESCLGEVAPVDPEHEKKVHETDQGGLEVHEELPANNNGYMGASGSFFHGFVATLSVIIVSELGDKTFFIAAIMAMRNPRWTVFVGAMSALALMHVMSAFFGYAITVIPRMYTYYLSSFLFALFGLKMLREGWKMSPNVSCFCLVIANSVLDLLIGRPRRIRRSPRRHQKKRGRKRVECK